MVGTHSPKLGKQDHGGDAVGVGVGQDTGRRPGSTPGASVIPFCGGHPAPGPS